MKSIMLTFLLTILILNFSPLPQFIGLRPTIEVYHYTALTGNEITEIPAKGKRIDFTQPGLRRNFEKKIWKVWLWREYLTHPRWQLDSL